MEQVTFIGAFFGGLLAFVSPCILPILPGYLSFITGISLEELVAQEKRGEVMFQAARQSSLFVLGFTIVFVALGTTAAAAGGLPPWLMDILGRVAGGVVVLFGLHLMGIINISFLNYEKRLEIDRKRGYFGTILLGMAFAIGWTPCVGPILSAIYLKAAFTEPTVFQGILYLLVFSLGIGIPFIVSAVFLSSLLPLFDRIKRHMRVVLFISGGLLVVMGGLMITGVFDLIRLG
jgi:cytochrome c-type biogenesis protein